MIKRTYFYHGHCHRKPENVPAGASSSHRFFSGTICLTSWFPNIDSIREEVYRVNMEDGEFEMNDIEVMTLNRL